MIPNNAYSAKAALARRLLPVLAALAMIVAQGVALAQVDNGPTTYDKDMIANLQNGLKMFGYYDGPENGILDKDTRYAIEVFRSLFGRSEGPLNVDRLADMELTLAYRRIEFLRAEALVDENAISAELAREMGYPGPPPGDSLAQPDKLPRHAIERLQSLGYLVDVRDDGEGEVAPVTGPGTASLPNLENRGAVSTAPNLESGGSASSLPTLEASGANSAKDAPGIVEGLIDGLPELPDRPAFKR